MPRWVLLAFIAVLSTIAHAQNGDTALLVVGGRVWTGDAERPWAEAVLTGGDRIVAVGDRAAVESRAPDNTTVIDAAGGLVTPGWIDSHVHLFGGGANLSSVQLRNATTPEAFTDRIARFVADLRPGEWVRGGDWDHTRWGGELPTREWIDAVSPDNPVWVQRLDGHMALANSAALCAAGVDASTATPDGGVIERDAAGRPTGLLRDNAMAIVGRVAPDPSASQQLAALDAATDYLLRRGVTSVFHFGSLNELRVLRSAQQAGRLRLRIRAATPLPRWRLLVDEMARGGEQDDWLRYGALKGFVDGSLGSHTAAMLEPFTDAPTDRGLLVSSAEDLYAWTSAADRAGLQVAVHAIGDRAIRLQLDVFERVAQENGPRDRRFRIEHAQHIAPVDLPRFAQLGVIASMQPYHAIDDGRWAEAVIGPQRSATTYAFRSLIDSGARLALGSDWFVAPATPIEGVYAAVTRRTLDGAHPGGWVPEQKIAVGEALRGYTADAAYALFAEGDKGMIRPGLLADLTVVDRDLFTVPPATLADARVRCTIVAGRVAWRQNPTDDSKGSTRLPE